MKPLIFLGTRQLLVASLIFLYCRCAAQDSAQVQITAPFDSVRISEVSAVGNLETGVVAFSMQVQSNYHKLATISFSGGGFGDFGLTDDRGVKYKYSSYTGPAGMNSGVNKGYVPLQDLRMGKSKVSIIISVQDTFHTGQTQTLSFRLSKVDKSVKTIEELHILCMLQLNYMGIGQRLCTIKNIPVAWVKKSS